MKIKELTESVDKIYDSLDNKEYYKIAQTNYKNISGSKTNQKHNLIAALIKDEYSNYDIGKITIWRLLKLKEQRPDLYKSVAEGKLKIKSAYNLMVGTNTKQNKDNDKNTLSLDLPDVYSFLKEVNINLDKNYNNLPYTLSENDIRDIDTELFKLRKTLNKIYNYYFSD